MISRSDGVVITKKRNGHIFISISKAYLRLACSGTMLTRNKPRSCESVKIEFNSARNVFFCLEYKYQIYVWTLDWDGEPSFSNILPAVSQQDSQLYKLAGSQHILWYYYYCQSSRRRRELLLSCGVSVCLEWVGMKTLKTWLRYRACNNLWVYTHH